MSMSITKGDPCTCEPEGCDNEGILTDRDGRAWCGWCHENGTCTDMEGHFPKPTAVTRKPDASPDASFVFACPSCGDTDRLGELAEILCYSRFDAPEGLVVANGVVDINWDGSTEVLDHAGDVKGVMCDGCGWELLDKNWREYVVNYEEREKERIRREFMKEAGLLDEDEAEDANEHPISTWEVPLIHGKVQIVIPVEGGRQPLVLEADMNTMEEPQDIHIDPKARTVSLTTKEPFVEVCDECEATVPENANSHVGDWHEPRCSLYDDEPQEHRVTAEDAPEPGSRKVYVYVTDKDMTRRLNQSLEAKQVALDKLSGLNWNSDDYHNGATAVSFDAPNSIPDDEILNAFGSIGLTAEVAS